MTILPWPNDRKAPHKRSPRKLIVDPLPDVVLRSLVADIPGPRNETEAERAVRFDLQMAEVLSFKPRDAAQAMLAAQSVMLRLVANDAMCDALRPGLDPAAKQKVIREVMRFEKMSIAIVKALTDRQSRPPATPDPAMFEALGLSEFLIPDPNDPAPEEDVPANDPPPDSPREVERDLSNVIALNVHPAPKTLQ